MPRRFREVRIHPNARPSSAFLRDVARETIRRRRPVDPSVRDLLRYVDPDDAADVRACRHYMLRFKDLKGGSDVLAAARCKNPWCPWCPDVAHRIRAAGQTARIASVNPARRAKPHVVNVVWTLPEQLRDLARSHPDAILKWLKAVRRTIARAYGYGGAKNVGIEDTCWASMGAIANLHAFGDAAEPWPLWAPHFDMLIPGFIRRDGAMRALRGSWPTRYADTARIYQEELRAALLPLVQTGAHRNVALQAFLAGDFPVDWHVSKAPEGGVVQTSRAMHRIRYSCRPLFTMARAKLRQDARGRDVLLYTTPAGRAQPQLVHRVAPGPAFGALRSMRPWLQGRHVTRYLGILQGKAYQDAARLAGHMPVVDNPPRSKKLKAVYAPDAEGRYVEQDPQTFRRGRPPKP